MSLTAYNYRDPIELGIIFDAQSQYDAYLLKNVFKTNYFHQNDSFFVDKIDSTDEIAQFVQNNADPKVVSNGGRTGSVYHAPRIYESKRFSANELAEFKVLDSSENAIQMANDSIVREVERMKDRLNRRLEAMACSAVNNGKIIINQSDLAAAIDFNIPDSQKIVRTGTAAWSSVDGNVVLNDIKEFQRMITRATGAQATSMYVGTDVAKAMLSNEDLRKSFDTSHYAIGDLSLMNAMGPSGSYLGTFAGVRVYEYHQQYSLNGTIIDMIGTKKAIMVADDSKAFGMHYGGIGYFDNQSIKVDAKPFRISVDQDPFGKYLEWRIESYPLPVIHNPKAIVSATVLE